MLRALTMAAAVGVGLLVAPWCKADRLLLAPSASLGLPLGPSASLVDAIALGGAGLDEFSPAVFLNGNIGVGGWMTSLGYGLATYGDSGGFPPDIIGTAVLGGGVTVLRTWGRPFNARTRETYVGATIFLRGADHSDDVGWGIDLGVLSRVDGPGRLMPYIAVNVCRFFAF